MRKLRCSAHLQTVPGFQQDGKTSAEKIVAQTEGTALMRNIEIFSTCIFQPHKREGDRDAHLLFWFIIRQNGTEKLAAIRVFGITAHEKDRARKSAFERFKEEHPEFAMVPIVALDA
ncbi:hypothetical protein [Roseibium sp.]|uniref:hypothetical protein n=1 Tax=Roseibium sp. TaxID=1936156 RepID=UPI003B5013BA